MQPPGAGHVYVPRSALPVTERAARHTVRMADSALLTRIRAHLDALDRLGEFEEKGIVGGTGFLLGGKLVCGEVAGALLVRLGKRGMAEVRAAAEAPGDPAVRPMTMAGKPSLSFYLVDPAGLRGRKQLGGWIDRAIEFAATLSD